MTHRYKAQTFRLFRGHRIPTRPPVVIEVGDKSSDRVIIAKAKQAVGWNGIQTHLQDLGDSFLLNPRSRPHTLLEVAFAS